MATQVQFRRGTTTQNNAFTGAVGEITYDTEAKTLRLHDGTTSGGGAIVCNLAGTQTLTNKTLSTNSTWAGNAVGLAYGGTNANITAAAGGIIYSTASAMAVTSAGTSGQVLTSAGSSAPTWTSQASLTVGNATVATRATNIDGGSAGYLVYQVDTNDTDFIPPGAAGTFLRSTGASTAPDWATASITIGSTEINLGSSSTSVAGLTSIDATSGATSFFATPTSPVAFAGATTLTIGYGSTASSTTNISTGAVASGNTKTINIGTGGAAGSTTNINLGDGDGGTVTVNKDLVVTGDLTVNGTTTTINSTTLDIDDINITVAKGAANAAAANGAGLTVDGANATILYTSATDSWNFNKPLKATNTDYWLLPVGTVAQRPGTPVNGMVRYNSDQSSFEGYASGAWSSLGGVKSVDGFTYILAETSAGASNGDLDFYAENAGGTAATQVGQWNRTNLKDYTGTIVGTQTTQNVFNTTATTVNAFGAATSLTLGATSGTATIRNSTVAVTNNATVGGTLGVTGVTTLTGALNANGGIAVDTNAFTVADTTGNTAIAGTLAVTGATTLTGALNANGGITVDTSNFTVDGTTGAVSTASTLSVSGVASLLSTLELGHASDTTLARSAAGVVTIEGVEIVTLSRSQTLTNKTINLANNTLTATSAQIAAAVTDETGSGSLVFATSPSLTTPNIGAATGTSLTTTGGGVLVRQAATQDGIEIRGRAGGTGNWEAILTPTTLSADRTFTFPDVSGTVVTTGDTGTVTSTMIADGTIVNADINASAAIAISKLAASTISGISLGNNLATLTIGTGLSGTSYNGSTAVTIANTGVTSITGTANQVTASASTGGVTLSLPQSINTTASVQFGSFGVGTAASGTTGEIRATNQITSFYSDERLKKDITEISGALDKVMQLRGVTFRSNDIAESYGYVDTKEQVGVIAQDVEKVLPQIVVPAPFDRIQIQEGLEISRSGENYKTVQYEKLVPLLIQAIKEQQVMIEELKKKVGI